MIRFVHLFNYAEGVSEKDGETWYFEKHVPQVKKLPDIIRYRSWKQVDVGLPFPSNGLPMPFNQFVRRTELCFGNEKVGVQTVMSHPELWQP